MSERAARCVFRKREGRKSRFFEFPPLCTELQSYAALSAVRIVDSSWWAGYWAHPWFSNYCSSPLSPYNSKSRACSRCRQVVNLGVWSQRCSRPPPPHAGSTWGGRPLGGSCPIQLPRGCAGRIPCLVLEIAPSCRCISGALCPGPVAELVLGLFLYFPPCSICSGGS